MNEDGLITESSRHWERHPTIREWMEMTTPLHDYEYRISSLAFGGGSHEQLVPDLGDGIPT